MRPFQPDLFSAPNPGFDASYARLERVHLDEHSWVDYAPGWVSGADALFEALRDSRRWAQRTRKLFDKEVLEPRMTSHWWLDGGEPLQPELLEAIRLSLGARYRVTFDSLGFNWYRDGSDSVAFHGDTIRREIAEPIVPLLSLGEPRRFLLKPREGGPSVGFNLGGGDLLVTGGRTQRAWLHAVPKVAHAGQRISVAFRYGLKRREY
jgi:alkylated DNA repair dioxygenase AlkB